MFEVDDRRDEDPNPSESVNANAPFVGRTEVKVRIKEAIKNKKFQLFQITGGAVVGKSRLAEVVSDELYKESLESKTQLKCVSLALRNKNKDYLELLKMKILQEFGKEGNFMTRFDFLDELKHTLKKNQYYLILLDDCDHMLSDNSRTDFFNLVSTLVTSCKRVKVILTIRQVCSFPRLFHTALHYHLTGLTDAECVELLNRSAPNVQFSQHEPLIIKHCSGLPLLLIILARTLEEHRSMLSKKDFLEVLEKFPLDSWNVNQVSDEDSIEKIMEQFVACLDDYLKHKMAILSYFSGSFSAEAAADVIGVREPEAKVFSLIPLHHKSMLEFDTTKGRFDISPVIRQFFNSRLTHLRDTETVRLRFCHYYSQILCACNNNLYEKGSSSVIHVICEDWSNLEQMLREAVQPTSDLYKTSMKIVRDAPDVVTSLLPELAEPFYRSCRSAAELLGTDFDMACIDSCLGASVGFTKGSGLRGALNLLLDTEKKIPADSGYQRVKLMAHIEWNLFRQGKMNEALRYQDLGLAVEPFGVDKRRIQRLHVNLKNHMALALLVLGRANEALVLLKETLEFTQETCKNHPAVRVILNSFGLAYSELNDQDTALKYFQASLTERRKLAGRDKRDLVVVLINVGKKLMGVNKRALALQHLNESVEIRKDLEWIHLDTAVAVYNRGQILRQCNRYQEALDDAREALSIYEQCVDSHAVLAGLRVEIAKCLELLGRLGEAEEILREVLPMRLRLEPNKQLYFYIIQAFDMLMNLLSGRSTEWSKVAEEKCNYYLSLIQDVKPNPTVCEQYKEELESLRKTMRVKMDSEQQNIKGNLNTLTPGKSESHTAVDKLLKAEGQPHNLKTNNRHIKSAEKEIPTSFVSGEIRKPKSDVQALEADGSSSEGMLGNNKITNAQPRICCKETFLVDDPRCRVDVRTADEGNFKSENNSITNLNDPVRSTEKESVERSESVPPNVRTTTDCDPVSACLIEQQSRGLANCGTIPSPFVSSSDEQLSHSTDNKEQDTLQCNMQVCSSSKIHKRNTRNGNTLNGNMQETKFESACFPADSPKDNDKKTCVNGNVDPASLTVDEEDCQADQRLDSDTSTLTGSYYSSSETIRCHSLENEPDGALCCSCPRS